MLPHKFLLVAGASPSNQVGVVYGGEDQHARETRGRIGGCGALRAGDRSEKGRILDELCSVTGWHRKHAIRVLSPSEKSGLAQQRQRHRTYGPSIRDALIALWKASDRLCGKRLVVMIPTLGGATVPMTQGRPLVRFSPRGSSATLYRLTQTSDPHNPRQETNNRMCRRLLLGLVRAAADAIT
jgi:hypothetical protein